MLAHTKRGFGGRAYLLRKTSKACDRDLVIPQSNLPSGLQGHGPAEATFGNTAQPTNELGCAQYIAALKPRKDLSRNESGVTQRANAIGRGPGGGRTTVRTTCGSKLACRGNFTAGLRCHNTRSLKDSNGVTRANAAVAAGLSNVRQHTVPNIRVECCATKMLLELDRAYELSEVKPIGKSRRNDTIGGQGSEDLLRSLDDVSDAPSTINRTGSQLALDKAPNERARVPIGRRHGSTCVRPR
jgi:hypothetical protein